MMRRGLVKRLPALTRFYGLKPEDLDTMTVREISEYLVQLEEWERAEDERRRMNG